MHEISNNVICAISKASDHSIIEYSMIAKLLTEHHLECLSLKGGCTGSSESTSVKTPHCWKAHVTAHYNIGFKKSLPEQGISLPVFYGDSVYKFKRIVWKLNFSDQFKTIEYGHVAYQIKENEAYNNMLVNILPLHTLDHWGAVKLSYIFVVLFFSHFAY